MQIIQLDGKRSILVITLHLKRRGRPDGGIEGDVTRLSVGRPGLNVTPSLAISTGEAPLASLASSQFVERGLQAFGAEISANRYRAFGYPVIAVRGLLALILGR